jgi:TPR repeat protein
MMALSVRIASIALVLSSPAFAAPPQAPPGPRVPPAKPPAAVAAEQAAAERAAAARPPAETPATLKARCDKGVADGCSRLADRYSLASRYFNKDEWKDDGLAADAALEFRYRLRACELGSVGDCGSAGDNFVSGEGVAKDVHRGITLLTRACDADHGSACDSLSHVYEKGDDVRPDARLALELQEKACRLGSVLCHLGDGALREFYATAGLPEKSPPRPLGAEVATCQRGDANACIRAALRYYSGEGGDFDGSRMAPLFAAACDRGLGDACLLLGNMLARGDWVKRNDAAAAAIYRNGCNLDQGTSCSVLGDMLRHGIGVPKDVGLADQLREKGCAHVSYACPEDRRKAAEARATAASSRAAAPASPAAPLPRPAAPAPFAIARARLGVDTVDSVERDIRARGGSPSSGGSGLGKFRFSALSGDYRDVGPDIMAVDYDFDAAGASGRLIAVTIARMRPAALYASLVAERKGVISNDVGPLRETSPTEFTATAAGVRVTLHVNADTGYLYEVYRLVDPASAR